MIKGKSLILKELEELIDEIYIQYREEYALNLSKESLEDIIYNRIISEFKRRRLNNVPINDIIKTEKYIEKYKKLDYIIYSGLADLIFALLLSAAINMDGKNRSGVIKLRLKRPYDNLLFRLKNREIEIDMTGDYLGEKADGSIIYAKGSRNHTGYGANNSIFILGSTGSYTLEYANNSKVFIKERAICCTGYNGRNLYIVANDGGNNIGEGSFNTTIIANMAGERAGYEMMGGKIYVNTIYGRYLGSYSYGVLIMVNKVRGSFIGEGADNLTLYIYEIENLTDISISPSFFDNHLNVLFVGEETFYQMQKIPKYRKYIEEGRIKIWDKEDYKRFNYELNREIEQLNKIRLY